MTILQEAENISDELAAIRHDIHMHPETGNNEFRTAALIEDYLSTLGIETKRLTETAVMGILNGSKPGRAIGFRADMDALPVTEATGCSFTSQTKGIMHACGHDVHTAALLGAAKLLSMHKEKLNGSVRFFFEPDEEDNGGARRMIEAGCMEGVNAVYGAHVDPNLPLGTVGVHYGKFYAASNIFNITVTGKSAHGAQPEKGIDALLAAAKMVTGIKELPQRFPEGEAVLSVGTLNSGTARNIIADKATFTGIIRTLGNDVKDGMLDSFRQVINIVSAEIGTTTDIYINSTHNGIVNTDRETALVEDTVKNLEGIEAVRIKKPFMTSEDFGFFIDEAAGTFFHIGAGSPYPLHSCSFLPDDRATVITAAVHTAVALKELA